MARVFSAQSNASGAVDPPHDLRVPALVDAVLGPRAGVVLRAADLGERVACPARGEAAHAVRVRVAGEVADEVVVRGRTTPTSASLSSGWIPKYGALR